MADPVQTVYEIPTIAQSQKFTIELNGSTYNMRIVWNAFADCWVLDISDINDTPIVQAIPLVTGVDLLGQYEYLGIGGGLLCMTDATPDAVPTYDNLGTNSHLYFVVNS